MLQVYPAIHNTHLKGQAFQKKRPQSHLTFLNHIRRRNHFSRMSHSIYTIQLITTALIQGTLVIATDLDLSYNIYSNYIFMILLHITKSLCDDLLLYSSKQRCFRKLKYMYWASRLQCIYWKTLRSHKTPAFMQRKFIIFHRLLY